VAQIGRDDAAALLTNRPQNVITAEMY